VLERYGVTLEPSNRIGTIKTCHNLLANAGFEEIEIKTEQHGSYTSLDKALAAWKGYDRIVKIANFPHSRTFDEIALSASRARVLCCGRA
jgi:hypothetical protein